MRKPKYRVDTYSLDRFDLSRGQPLTGGIIIGGPRSKQMVFEDELDELAEQGWEVVTTFVASDRLWRISRRTLWWRLMN